MVMVIAMMLIIMMMLTWSKRRDCDKEVRRLVVKLFLSVTACIAIRGRSLQPGTSGQRSAAPPCRDKLGEA